MKTQLLRIAVHNVARNRRRSLITFTALFLALGVMVGLRGFLNGLQATIRESVILGQTGALQVHRRGYLKAVLSAPLSLNVPADAGFLARIAAVPNVSAVTARIAFGGLANANDISTVALFFAIDPQRELSVCPRRLEMIASGTSLAESGPQSGIFTPELKRSLGLPLGQRATILVNDRDGVLSAQELDVVGEYGQPGLPMPDKKLGYVPLRFAQELLRLPDRATEIAIAVRDPEQLTTTQARVQAIVGADYEVSTWHDLAPHVDSVIATQNFVLNLIATIFLFMALLGIANTMLMSVLERTREIGTMMSLGVRRRQILGLFLLEASLLGLLGGGLGAALSSGLVFYYGHGHHGILFRFPGILLPLHVRPWIDPSYIQFVLLLAVSGAALAVLGPSLRALKLRPIEALSAV